MGVLNITPDNPLVISSKDDLRVVMRELLVECGLLGIQEPVVREAGKELTTRQAKKYLGEKGYQVSSTKAFNALIEQHSINGQRKGKDNWYRVSELDKIPNKTM